MTEKSTKRKIWMSLRQGKPRRMNSLTDPEILDSEVLISLTCGSDLQNHWNIYTVFLLPGKGRYVDFPQFRFVTLPSSLWKSELVFPLCLLAFLIYSINIYFAHIIARHCSRRQRKAMNKKSRAPALLEFKSNIFCSKQPQTIHHRLGSLYRESLNWIGRELKGFNLEPHLHS